MNFLLWAARQIPSWIPIFAVDSFHLVQKKCVIDSSTFRSAAEVATLAQPQQTFPCPTSCSGGLLPSLTCRGTVGTTIELGQWSRGQTSPHKAGNCCCSVAKNRRRKWADLYPLEQREGQREPGDQPPFQEMPRRTAPVRYVA